MSVVSGFEWGNRQPVAASTAVSLDRAVGDRPRAGSVATSLDEDRLREEQPLARAKLIRHLESVLDLCEDNMRGREEVVEGTVIVGPPDPRWTGLKIATIKELAKLYQLEKKAEPVPIPVDPLKERQELRDRVLGALEQLEARSA